MGVVKMSTKIKFYSTIEEMTEDELKLWDEGWKIDAFTYSRDSEEGKQYEVKYVKVQGV